MQKSQTIVKKVKMSMAGAVGFEPTNADSKNRCDTQRQLKYGYLTEKKFNKL